MSAYTPDGIDAAIHRLSDEMDRRDTLMLEAQARDFAEVMQPASLSYVVVVVDEAEAIFDSFTNRTQAQEFRKRFRDVVRRGRNSASCACSARSWPAGYFRPDHHRQYG